MILKFGQGMDMDDLEVDPVGQGHRSNVKVTRSKNVISGLILQLYTLVAITFYMEHLQAKCTHCWHIPVKLIDISNDIGMWAHFNVKLHFFLLEINTDY